MVITHQLDIDGIIGFLWVVSDGQCVANDRIGTCPFDPRINRNQELGAHLCIVTRLVKNDGLS